MAGLTLAEMVEELNVLAGLDLTAPQAKRYLNEGNRELTVRAEWRRANASVGPTVVGQAAYSLPADLNRIRKLKVNGQPYVMVDEPQVDQLKLADMLLRAYGVYWLSFDASAVEKVSLYPLPTVAGLAITANVILYPPDLVDDANEPVVPADYRRAIVDYAAGLAYGYQEDNPELRQFHMDLFSEAVAKLRRLRFSRASSGPVQMRVIGVTG